MSRLAHLIVTPPEAKPFTHILDKHEVTAGRDLTADMTIEDSLLSRVHLRFVLQGEAWQLQDDGSRNGTFVNGKRVQKGERIALVDGAQISAGLTKIKFSFGERSMDAPPLHRVTRPTEDYFSIAELVAEKPNDIPAALTRLLIRVSEELLPERIPERVLRAACTMSATFLDARSVSVQRLRPDGKTEPLVFAGEQPRTLDAGELQALMEHRGARMLRDAKGKRLVISLDAPRQSVLVADVPNDVDQQKLKLVVAIGALTSGIYDAAVSHSDLRKDNQRLLDQVRVGFAYDIDTPACMAGSSLSAQTLREAVEKASGSDEALTIVGERGVGKELLARAIHARSKRAAEPFIVVDASKKERVAALAQYATIDAVLFIEHPTAEVVKAIAELKKPRVILSNESLDVTHGTRIEVAPLRTRPEDIALIAEKTLGELNTQHKTACSFDKAALAWIEKQPWLDNVRGLLHSIERALLIADASVITVEELEAKQAGGDVSTLPDAIATFEKDYVLRVLQAQHGHRIRTAGILGISRQALGRKLRAWGMITGEDDE